VHRAILLAALVAGTHPAEAVRTLKIAVELRSEEEIPAGARVTVTGRQAAVVTTPLRKDAMSIPLHGHGPWQVSCEGAGLWCPVLSVSAAQAARPVTLPVFRSSTGSAAVSAPRGESLPDRITVEGRFGDARDATLDFIARAGVSEARFRVPLPRARLDLRLSAKGWAPAYLWDVQPRGEAVDLGTFSLRRGSSVSAFVVDPSAELPLAGVQASLSPLVSPDQPGEKQRATLLQARAETNARGFLQIPGVLPGRYRLDLSRGEEAAVTLDPFDVGVESETHLGRIVLSPPVRLDVTVSPPVDMEGRPWRVQLWPHLAGSVFVQPDPLVAQTAEEGTARFARLRVGRYEVNVLDQAGSVYVSQSEEIVSSRELPVSVPLVRVRGTVMLGESPLPAELHLTLAEADSVHLRSDDDGQFEGWLRRPSRPFLLVEIKSDSPRVRRLVEFRDLKLDDEIFDLSVRLDDTSLSGKVVDDEGAPVADATVDGRVSHMETFSVRTDGQGRFAIRGVAEGKIVLWPSHPRWPPAPVVEVDTTGGSISGLTLVLTHGRSVRGRLVADDDAPVAGAQVVVDVVGLGPFYRWAETDAAGNFKILLPKDATRAHVIVLAPTQMLWSSCVTLPSGHDWRLSLPPLPTSELVLRTTTREEYQPPLTSGELILFRPGGAMLRHQELFTWQRTLRGDVPPVRAVDEMGRPYLEKTFDGLAPGAYAAIWSETPWHALVARHCSLGPPADLEWTTLAPGGSGTVRYDMTTVRTGDK
jgi:hypothetical protein